MHRTDAHPDLVALAEAFGSGVGFLMGEDPVGVTIKLRFSTFNVHLFSGDDIPEDAAGPPADDEGGDQWG